MEIDGNVMSTAAPAPRITVINDSAEFLDLMRDLLSDAGYHVSTFKGAVTPIEDIAASHPDLLVIDLRLGGPERDGWSIAMLARSAASLETVPIIICSADLEQLRLRQDEMTVHADVHVLAKPFGLADAEELIGRLLART